MGEADNRVLIKGCKCRQGYYHFDCMAQWIESSEDRSCDSCLQPFTDDRIQRVEHTPSLTGYMTDLDTYSDDPSLIIVGLMSLVGIIWALVAIWFSTDTHVRVTNFIMVAIMAIGYLFYVRDSHQTYLESNRHIYPVYVTLIREYPNPREFRIINTSNAVRVRQQQQLVRQQQIIREKELANERRLLREEELRNQEEQRRRVTPRGGENLGESSGLSTRSSTRATHGLSTRSWSEPPSFLGEHGPSSQQNIAGLSTPQLPHTQMVSGSSTRSSARAQGLSTRSWSEPPPFLSPSSRVGTTQRQNWPSSTYLQMVTQPHTYSPSGRDVLPGLGTRRPTQLSRPPLRYSSDSDSD